MASSIAYQTSPGSLKRPSAHKEPPNASQKRSLGGFVVEDDSESEPENTGQPPCKKRMLVSGPEASSSGALFDLTAESGQVNTFAHDSEDSCRVLGGSETTSAVQMLRDKLFNNESRLPGLMSTSNPLNMPSATASTPSDYTITTCTGEILPISTRKPFALKSYESMIADRSKVKEGRARKAYYGIDIHALIDDAKAEIESAEQAQSHHKSSEIPSPDQPMASVESTRKPHRTPLWTEKYRAKTFMDLCGDDSTNRMVLRWLKKWDPLVFPQATRRAPAARRRNASVEDEEKPLRKILLLTGPPGLGKTTLAHVCARQAGYDVLEINASDDRSKDVVRNRIRTTLGTECVRYVTGGKASGKHARPVCVIVDEVDGVVTGSGGGGEGGFIKELINLVSIDQRNSIGTSSRNSGSGESRRRKRGDDFRQMRPLVLICNDIYSPALRPLRNSGFAEVIHAGKPTLEAVVQRLKSVFEKEGITCEKDAARRVCEAAWGMTSGLDARKGANSTTEGDLRGVMVVGEWVAGRLRASFSIPGMTPKLTRGWVDQHVMGSLSADGSSSRGLGRGGAKEIVARVFQHGAGFPTPVLSKTNSSTAVDTDGSALHATGPRSELPKTHLDFAEHQCKNAISRLREMVNSSGETDRVVSDIWSEFPSREFNDDSFLSKPNECYDWLHFHDSCMSRIYGGAGGGQEWELGPYLASPVLAAHILFSGPIRHARQQRYDPAEAAVDDTDGFAAGKSVFSGPRAEFTARETEKENRVALSALQAQLPPTLGRAFKNAEQVATDLIPYLLRLISPDVKPVVVSSASSSCGPTNLASVRKESEKKLVNRAADVLHDLGISLVKGRLEDASQQDGNNGSSSRSTWVYRFDPDVDALAAFETAAATPSLASGNPVARFAVRQVLDQELAKTAARRENESRMARFKAGASPSGSDAGTTPEVPPDGEEAKENAGSGTNIDKKRIAARQGAATAAAAVKKDFFGRVIAGGGGDAAEPLGESDGNAGAGSVTSEMGKTKKERRPHIWVTYHEGINNAVRKPISLEQLLTGL